MKAQFNPSMSCSALLMLVLLGTLVPAGYSNPYHPPPTTTPTTTPATTATTGGPMQRNCLCNRIYRPVCGVNGKTYGNECLARCNNVKKFNKGECGLCICPLIFAPVCSGGREYPNECSALCAGRNINSIRQGHCPNCACKERSTDRPVCYKGITYPSRCCARCAEVLTPRPGRCTQCSNCSNENKPVCSMGRTYPNECKARCAGATQVAPGACTPCTCNRLVEAPVCAGGQDYPSECAARCAGNARDTIRRGRCQSDAKCKCQNQPSSAVCGDGKTYANRCEARCAGANNIFPGACNAACSCIQVFMPVCAKGTTFSNSCIAACAGVKNWRDGACDSDSA